MKRGNAINPAASYHGAREIETDYGRTFVHRDLLLGGTLLPRLAGAWPFRVNIVVGAPVPAPVSHATLYQKSVNDRGPQKLSDQVDAWKKR